jgi:hypothetical protein
MNGLGCLLITVKILISPDLNGPMIGPTIGLPQSCREGPTSTFVAMAPGRLAGLNPVSSPDAGRSRILIRL